jgi:hypothetical protein
VFWALPALKMCASRWSAGSLGQLGLALIKRLQPNANTVVATDIVKPKSYQPVGELRNELCCRLRSAALALSSANCGSVLQEQVCQPRNNHANCCVSCETGGTNRPGRWPAGVHGATVVSPNCHLLKFRCLGSSRQLRQCKAGDQLHGDAPCLRNS